MADEDAAAAMADDEDVELWEAAVSTVVTEQLEGSRFRNRALLRRYNRNGPLRRLVTARARRQYLDAGGDPGDVQSFLTWLIENWESILKMVMSIIALFTV